MADETEGRRDEQPSGDDDQQEYTPRKARPEGGDFKQTTLRDDIVNHMRHEMLVCSADDFLKHLAPFDPSDAWIERAFECLEKQELLGTSAEKTTTATVSNRRKTKNSARAGASATLDVGAAEPEVATKDARSRRWRAYPDGDPQSMDGTENKVFGQLKSIVNALLDCPNPDHNPESDIMQKQELNRYRYLKCPDNSVKSEITGADLRVDAVISNKDIYKEDGIALAAVQIAVPMEFKKKADPQTVFKNRKQLVSAANHIMNDDPRRKWMYGITIENTDMSLWYFSHSYSMKSEPFNFTTDLEKFIRVFLSFLYASEEQLGYDTTIHRMMYNKDWCCVFEMKVINDVRCYYRSVESLHNPQALCITGWKLRVWKVVEVSGLEDLKQKPNTSEVVLKDCWIDADALLEKEIQRLIFKQLAAVDEAKYAWAPTELQDKLKAGLKCPETYFMEITLDRELGTNKPKPRFCPDPTLLAPPIEKYLANKGKTIPSTQTPPGSRYPSSHSSHLLPPPGTSAHKRKARRYNIKKHYRVIYAEVGQSLAYAKSLSDAIRAFEDTFIALTLLFLAGWVHRDISERNIILVRGRDGVRAKLSDLEYARPFGAKGVAVSTDPKTGTPYFMLIEIHTGSFLITPPPPENLGLSSMKLESLDEDTINDVSPPSLRYIFAHDLESLWWIMVWTIVMRIKGGPWLYHELLFVVLNYPHHDRKQFFKKGTKLLKHLKSLINDALCDRRAHTFLYVYNLVLLDFYQRGKREEVASYRNLYEVVWNALEQFVSKMSDVSMELENPHSRSPPPLKRLPADADVRKRARSVGVSDTPAESSSKKKQKSGGDVFSDIVENETAEDGMAEDDLAEDYTVEDNSGEDFKPEDNPAEDDSDTD